MTKESRIYATLSSEAYNNLSVGESIDVGGHHFKAIYSASGPFTGFQATAFREDSSGKTILAYRGTQALDDGAVDLGMVIAKVNAQEFESEAFTDHAISIARQYADANNMPLDVTVTGHSLGGTLAQINAAHFGLKGETFNAYGASGLTSETIKPSHSLINHVRAGDPVSAANPHFGDVEIYAAENDISALSKAGYESSRGIGNVVRSISLESHEISNFVPDEKGYSLLNEDAERLYQNNKKMIDNYRSDVMSARELSALSINHPQAVATLGVGLAAHAYTAKLRNEVKAIRDAATAVADQGYVVDKSMHTSAFSSSSFRGTWSSLPQSEEKKDPRITDAAHPGNALFKQALEGTQRLDAEQGRSPDKLSTNLAGSLAVAAQRQGMDRIDHVLLSDDASQAYAVQGELSSPFKKIAQVQTELGISASIEQSSKEWTQASAQRQQAELAQAMERSQQAAQDQAVPSPGRSLH
ncbi:DUF2974 domain-containing protein [Rothia nasimurium]|uniref:X-Tfes XVIPCD domain-containing protein n=1 Tax=Luteibacter anthropi TaxID=564369 RepID=A0A7X5ZHY6_9GAMM|nr:XVIPCD domain-containing protein [Luteibacter anthropi]NII06292.1 hypothetical protein [Luteibacter anthropi]